MTRALPITGEYPPDWPAIRDRVRAEAAHRCIRCGHPYEVGKHGKGEWSRCDSGCTHGGPIAVVWHGEYRLTTEVDRTHNLAFHRLPRFARWRILTVHHADGNKANCSWWNLLALCQRCHLEIQGRVNPETPYFLEHSEWYKPYVAGFYAKKYEGREITRKEATNRLTELLAHERLT